VRITLRSVAATHVVSACCFLAVVLAADLFAQTPEPSPLFTAEDLAKLQKAYPNKAIITVPEMDAVIADPTGHTWVLWSHPNRLPVIDRWMVVENYRSHAVCDQLIRNLDATWKNEHPDGARPGYTLVCLIDTVDPRPKK